MDPLIAQARAMRANGEKLVVIALELGRSHTWAYNNTRDVLPFGALRGRPSIVGARLDEVRALLASGLSVSAASRQIGCDRRTIQRRLKRAA
jgi:transcriptional regulator of acetoin/glycerol metabolism